tara:strand:- start:38024 stop:38515 length:492 start_codon:yes stop_codon:yes gene_type:complete
LLVTIGLVACGGGGGGGATVPPGASAANLQLQPVTILAGQTIADLTVSLERRSEPGPALLQGMLSLPPELSLPATERLAPATPMVTLDGNFVGSEFAVLCGDASNQVAEPLPEGDLFRLRLMPTPPRRPGSYTVTFHDVRAATSAGGNVPLAVTTLTATVVIQ